MTRMVWLDMNQPKFKQEEIGSHRKYSNKGKNAATVDTFKQEFRQILAWLKTVLRGGRYACFVMGDSTLRGERIDNSELISKEACEVGFLEVGRLDRTLQVTKKAFNPSIGKIKKEKILILRNEM
jgi:site-specific DNA-methyltransferase (cytosine-N4-specific)